MESKDMICILCPLGCKMQVSEKPGQADELAVRGIQCKKGKEYASEEFKNPTRTFTSTVVIHNAPLPRLPVRTNKPLPKGMVFDAMDVINAIELEAPVRMGDTIVEGLLGTDIDIIASRSLMQAKS